MKYFTVGQEVWHYEYGKRVVVKIDHLGCYPILVDFKHQTHAFTCDGRSTTYNPVTLSQKPLPIVEIYNEPIHEYKEGDYVWVKFAQQKYYECRQYKRFSSEMNRHLVYASQSRLVSERPVREIFPYDQRPF